MKTALGAINKANTVIQNNIISIFIENGTEDLKGDPADPFQGSASSPFSSASFYLPLS